VHQRNTLPLGLSWQRSITHLSFGFKNIIEPIDSKVKMESKVRMDPPGLPRILNREEVHSQP
jgi:hypothetical protein